MTTQTTRADPASQQTSKDYKAGSEKAVATRNKLNNDEGKISVAQGVVQKIAGMACREMSGVHSMGTGGSRAFGAIRERIPGSSGPNVAQGVGVEVGETQAAIDLDIVVEYGVSVVELGRSIQRNVKTSIERMTGLEVVEVNVNVDDVNLPDTGDAPDPTRVS
ncbi:Asp23/Gls24 family envelope stress response protein [Actinoplanes hulinensis]|uniref:Asp23/Gls24 family envelope stress response protein n=1 Tax=Actinoplanes hulinensis TaxID=1144547 RepID=A0ABS7BG32_9ACTN|nr:Asp23/Gls24 family envelope stress response protein [Actinoplanes hulinensis]MBW6439800.1 Asp23/Gls24 family envelope stress response protein [Actinoplanes hulinensis]